MKLRYFGIPALAAFIFAIFINTHVLGLTFPLLLVAAAWMWDWHVAPIESWDDELRELLKAGR